MASSVSAAWSEDLRTIAPAGKALLPAWICDSMVSATAAAGWTPVFYPPVGIDGAVVPLQLDLERLLAICFSDAIVNSAHALLLAHPLGHVDPGVSAAKKALAAAGVLRQHRLPFLLYVDMAQSYGYASLDEQLDESEALYLSFNGNKLLSRTGALRLVKGWSESSEADQVHDLRKQILVAVEEQHRGIPSVLGDATAILGLSMADFQRRLFSDRHRSSWHRIAFLSEALPLEALTRLMSEGLAQTIVPSAFLRSRGNESIMAEWFTQAFVLFSKKRRSPA